MAPVIVLPPHTTDLTGFHGHALIDTGATTSGLSPQVISALSLPPMGKRLIGSAQGSWQTERHAFRLALPTTYEQQTGYPFVFEETLGFALTQSFQWNVLIGMDILRQCDFQMDRRGRAYLTFG